MKKHEKFYLPAIHNAFRSASYQYQRGCTDRGMTFINSALNLLKTMSKTYKITQIYEDGTRRPRFRHQSEESANLWLRWLARNEPQAQAQIEPEIDKEFNTKILAQQEKQLLAGLIGSGFEVRGAAEDFAWIVLLGRKPVCEIRFEGSEWLVLPKAAIANYEKVYTILDAIREELVA